MSACDDDVTSDWAAGLMASHSQLKSACDAAAAERGSTCTLISNYATNDAMKVCDGGMVERFGCTTKYISTVQELAAAGKLVQVHAQDAAKNEGIFNSSLACHLVAMGQHTYFGAGDGWCGDGHDRVMTTWLEDYPEYSMPLGEPLALANETVVGSTTLFSRQFATGTRVVVSALLSHVLLAPLPAVLWRSFPLLPSSSLQSKTKSRPALFVSLYSESRSCVVLLKLLLHLQDASHLLCNSSISYSSHLLNILPNLPPNIDRVLVC